MLGVSSLFLLLLLTLSVVGFSQHTPKLSRDDFPPGFILGAGTSAFQVEGAVAEDGRSPSVWDAYTQAGKMMDKSNADVTSDQYHKYKEDVKLMSEMGLDAYRFSISWSRILPHGRGAVNPKGVQYYNNLINELISHGIQPHVTLYHLDLPQILEDEYSGWLSPKIVSTGTSTDTYDICGPLASTFFVGPTRCLVHAFGDLCQVRPGPTRDDAAVTVGCTLMEDFTAYADVCFREFGDRVAHWTTLNEPNVGAIASYDSGLFPPQRCSYSFGSNCKAGNSTVEPYIAVHHALLAHASAAALYREKYQAKQKGLIGLNVYSFWCIPFTNSTADVKATQRALDFFNGWIINPVVFGDYPEIMKKNAGSRIPSFTRSESEQVKGSIDFLGVNHYITAYTQDDSDGPKSNVRDYHEDMFAKFRRIGNQILPIGLPAVPSGLQSLLEYYKNEYGNIPIYVQENGFGGPQNESLNDTARVEYISGYLNATLSAIRNGSNTKGYIVWSFLDVFEFLAGYSRRYGFYHVDFEDKARTRRPKLSAHWYTDLLKKRKDMKIEMATQQAMAHPTQ